MDSAARVWASTDADDQRSVVGSCGIYEFTDGELSAITSYAVELPPTD